MGVTKGDLVALYMPMVPEAAIAMLACARMGHPIPWSSVVSPLRLCGIASTTVK